MTENYYTRYPVVTAGQVEGYVVIHDLFAEPDPAPINWRKADQADPQSARDLDPCPGAGGAEEDADRRSIRRI